MQRKAHYITATILLLSLISMFTDIASEMLYPVMPLYLQSIGFSIVLIGVLEGMAEAVAGLSKGYFGKLSDASGKRVPFVRAGYALSALSKPMLAVMTAPVWVFFSRTIDRFGKGIRTGARDALLSDETTKETKGKVFGFHRAMDTLGAVLGPVAALIYLQLYPGNYKTLFLIAFIPGISAIFISTFIKDHAEKSKTKTIQPFFSFLTYWKISPAIYKKVVAGLLVFTLFNSSDVFLLLRLKEQGITDVRVLSMYIFYNLVYALAAFPMGMLADKIGLKKTFTAGLILFAIVYFGMAVSAGTIQFIIIFLLYGLYAASTEGISKAWITNISGKEDTATAIGFFTAFQSICTMIASSLTGWIWYAYGAKPAFLLTGAATTAVIVYLLLVTKEPEIKLKSSRG
jgi:MFS family permease